MKAEVTENIQQRKTAHIDLAGHAQIQAQAADARFFYEPLLATHPQAALKPIQFLKKTLKMPIWVSSMTGGTNLAHTINHNLAKACKAFGMGMGLGSCRVLLDNEDRLKDFDLRAVIGQEQLLFANLGIAQVEQAVLAKNIAPIDRLVEKLQVDGLIIHVNPLQEWLQPEGDRFTQPPIKTISAFVKEASYPVIVKEVGQGMGPESLRALLQLPLAAIEFGAFGGTNFTQVELLRNDSQKQSMQAPWALVGHSAEQMVRFVNQLTNELGSALRCRNVIISGGVRSFLDGYYLTHLTKLPAVYGQASALLAHAKISYKALKNYLEVQIQNLTLAHSLLKIKI